MNVPETFFSVHEELILFGMSCIAGVVIGVLYDVLRALRVIFPHGTLLTALEDVLFLIGYAVFLPSFASAASRGELRFYYVIGNAAGFMLYYFTVGSIVIRIFKKLFKGVGKVLGRIFAPAKRLGILMCKKAKVKFVGSSKVLVKSIKKSILLLPKRLSMLYNESENKKRKNVGSVAETDEKENKEKRSVQ